MDNGRELLQVTLSAVESLKYHGTPPMVTKREEDTTLFSPVGTPTTSSRTPSLVPSSSPHCFGNSTPSTPSLSVADESSNPPLFTPSHSMMRVRVPSSLLKEVPSPYESREQDTPTPPPALKAVYNSHKPTLIPDETSGHLASLSKKKFTKVNKEPQHHRDSSDLQEDQSSTNDSVVVVNQSALNGGRVKQNQARRSLSTFKPASSSGRVVYPVMVQATKNADYTDKNDNRGDCGDTSVRNLAAVITSSATAAAVTASKQWLDRAILQSGQASNQPTKKTISVMTDKRAVPVPIQPPPLPPPSQGLDKLGRDVAKEIRGLQRDFAAEVQHDREQILQKLDAIHAMQPANSRAISTESRHRVQGTHTESFDQAETESKTKTDDIFPDGKEVKRCLVDTVTQAPPETKLNPANLEGQQLIIRSVLKDKMKPELTVELKQACARLGQVQAARKQIDLQNLWLQRDQERVLFHRLLQDSNLAQVHAKLESMCHTESPLESSENTRTCRLQPEQCTQPGNYCVKRPNKAASQGSNYAPKSGMGVENRYPDSSKHSRGRRGNRQRSKPRQSRNKPPTDDPPTVEPGTGPTGAVDLTGGGLQSVHAAPLFGAYSEGPVRMALPLSAPQLMPSTTIVPAHNHRHLPVNQHLPELAPIDLQPVAEEAVASEHEDHTVKGPNAQLFFVQSADVQHSVPAKQKPKCQLQVLPSVDIDTNSSATESSHETTLQPIPKVDYQEYAEFTTVFETQDTSTESSEVGSAPVNQPHSIKGHQEVLVSQGSGVAIGATLTCDYPYNPTSHRSAPCNEGVDHSPGSSTALLLDRLRNRLVVSITDRIREEVTVRLMSEQAGGKQPLDAVSCSTCTGQAQDEGDKEEQEEDSNSETLHTIVQEALLDLVRQTLLKHGQKMTTDSPAADQDFAMHYSDDFDGSLTTQSLSTPEATPPATPPTLARSRIDDGGDDGDCDILPVDTPLSTPLESSDELGAGDGAPEKRRHLEYTERAGGSTLDTDQFTVPTVPTPHPTTDEEDEDTLVLHSPERATRSHRSEDRCAAVPTPSVTPPPSIEEPSSLTSSVQVPEVQEEKREITLSETATTSTTLTERASESSSSELTTTFNPHLSFGEYIKDPATKPPGERVVYHSGSVLSEGEVPRLVRTQGKSLQKDDSNSGASMSSESDPLLTPQSNVLSLSEDSTSKLDDLSVGEVRAIRSADPYYLIRKQKDLRLSSPSDSSTPCQPPSSSSSSSTLTSSGDDSTSSGSLSIGRRVGFKPKQPHPLHARSWTSKNSNFQTPAMALSPGAVPPCWSVGEVPPSAVTNEPSLGEITRGSSNVTISQLSEGEIPRGLKISLDPPGLSQAPISGSPGEVPKVNQTVWPDGPAVRGGIDVIVVRSAKERVKQKYQHSGLSAGEIVRSCASETLASLDTTAELRDTSSISDLPQHSSIRNGNKLSHINDTVAKAPLHQQKEPPFSEQQEKAQPYEEDTFSSFSSTPQSLPSGPRRPASEESASSEDSTLQSEDKTLSEVKISLEDKTLSEASSKQAVHSSSPGHHMLSFHQPASVHPSERLPVQSNEQTEKPSVGPSAAVLSRVAPLTGGQPSSVKHTKVQPLSNNSHSTEEQAHSLTPHELSSIDTTEDHSIRVTPEESIQSSSVPSPINGRSTSVKASELIRASPVSSLPQSTGRHQVVPPTAAVTPPPLAAVLGASTNGHTTAPPPVSSPTPSPSAQSVGTSTVITEFDVDGCAGSSGFDPDSLKAFTSTSLSSEVSSTPPSL